MKESAMVKRKGKQTGTRRMAQLGYKPVQLWLTKELHALVRAAAELDGRPMTQFLIQAGVAKASEVFDGANGATEH
jgi:uncharacterized protein (DUF1778 family)